MAGATTAATERRAKIRWLTHRNEWLDKCRPNQLPPPGEWDIWMALAGRSFGKTRLAAEHFAHRQWTLGNRICHVIAPTNNDIRKVIYEGPAGLLNIIPPECIAKDGYNKQLGTLYLTNGSQFHGFSAESPERLRGPQCHDVWGDEFAAWDQPKGNAQYTWDMSVMGNRLTDDRGTPTSFVLTTTPKPVSIIKDMVDASRGIWTDNSIRYRDYVIKVTIGKSSENFNNLAPNYVRSLSAYEGTRLGRQELGGELLFDVPGSLWDNDMIEKTRVHELPEDLSMVVIGVDPNVSNDPNGKDEVGIIAAGIDGDRHTYVFEDISGPYGANHWPEVVYNTFKWHMADLVVAESNNGGDLIENSIRTYCQSIGVPMIPFRKVYASRGKFKRAQPVSVLFENGTAHLFGTMNRLEDEMCSFVPDETGNGVLGRSPNRCDAMVWAVTELALGGGKQSLLFG